MADVDPETLLEWLQMGQGDERDMQLIALEQLCMLLLMSDNVDRCFESCPPRTFLPALCRIFLDECAPDNVLEVTARAITYYLDVSAECTRRIVAVEGAIKALCNRLVVAEMSSRTSKDLAEQCIKVLELICTRESGAVFEAGGLNCVLTFIREHGSQVHKDTLHSSMTVVSRLCGKMEPQDAALETCIESLSTLLDHDDSFVADGALRCFASLADRYTRRSLDPAPLARHGLIQDLLSRLQRVAETSHNQSTTATPGKSTIIGDSKTSPSVSTVISLLSTLCRGSPGITHTLLRSNLPEAIESGLRGDERCCLDTMRFVDLLLVLLFEGRQALPKTGMAAITSRLPGLRRTDSSSDRSHRQLIDCIRSKDTDALIDAVDNGFEVNFMDDVGQTLLNWASAFGTQEMVEFLCERGADVNRGLRSSSLHYAACFGRPQIVKTLLRYGANPDLRDEDAKTPLDKARERGDEGHREVIAILQSPGEYMVPVTRDTSMAVSVPGPSTASVPVSAPAPMETTEKERKEESQEVEKGETSEVKGDPEVAPVYVRQLLPVFTDVFHVTMLSSVRKASLSLIRKMLHYIDPELLSEMTGPEFPSPNFAASLTEVLSIVLDAEEDDDGHMIVLQIMQDLILKCQDVFLEHFARLGLFSRVLALAGPAPQEEEGVKAKEEKVSQLKTYSGIAIRVVVFSYKPRGGGRDCLYLWSEGTALELSNGSNGWFRFILDGKLATMYSSGSPEGGSDSSENRGEFLDKLQRARSQIKIGTPSQPILSKAGPARLVVGNWTLTCKKDGELQIQNTDGQQATILREDLMGFVFESNRGTKHSFTAETTLGQEFAVGWSGKKSRKLKSKNAMKDKVRTTARELYEEYFKAAEAKPRGVVSKLCAIVQQLESAFARQLSQIKPSSDGVSWCQEMCSALEELVILLKDEHTISSFELYNSGLVQTLLSILSTVSDEPSPKEAKKQMRSRIHIFKSVFHDHERENLTEEGGVTPAVQLTRKLVSALEAIEKLPVYAYDLPGSGYGLQVRPRCRPSITYNYMFLLVLFKRLGVQAAENVAESMVNLASSEAIVMVTVDNADEEASTPCGTSHAISGGAGPSTMGLSRAGPSGMSATINSNMTSVEPMVVVHRGNDDSLGDYGVLDLASDLALGLDVGSLSETLRGAEGGVKEHVQNLQNARDSRDKAAKSEARKVSGTDDTTRGSPTNSMSASEPNLPTSLDPTASLLDSFAARRNMSTPHGSNIVRNSHANSLVRLALANSPNNLLSAAQSYPSLTASNVPTSSTLTATQTMANVMSLSQHLKMTLQALTRSVTSTSSESDNEFLETYRAHTLLAELEDDEELPEPDDDDDENEDENEDDEDYDDVMEDEEMEPRDRRTWDDEFVLKRQFSALIPAFDPRPGRTNVNQTQDFDIPPPGTEEKVASDSQTFVSQPKLCLTLKAPCLPGMNDEEVVLTSSSACIFKFVQELLSRGSQTGRIERMKRIWEPTYTVQYREAKEDEGSEKECGSITKSLTGVASLADFDLARGSEMSSCSVDHVLHLLQRLYSIMEQSNPSTKNDCEEIHLNIPADEFVSKKITNKVTQQIQTLYVTDRSIVWLQNKRDANVERSRGPLPRREDSHEYRVGRLKHERVVVPRNENLLDWAMQVMKHHATRKAVLEIEFKGEEGTGLGPTLEFYALVAAELQKKSHGLWLCDDDHVDHIEREVDIGHGSKPPGYYVQRSAGLFPAPIPQDSPELERLEKLFHFMGILLAKCLQDGRLIDMPLSRPFLKLMCMGEVGHSLSQQFGDTTRTPSTLGESWHSESSDLIASIEEVEKEMKFDSDRRHQFKSAQPWYAGILTEEDFELVNPHRAVFLQQLRDLAARKQRILKDRSLSDDQKNVQLAELALSNPGDSSLIRLEDLGLTFEFDPSSRVHKFHAHHLKPGGGLEEVNMDNVEEYIDLVMDFCFVSGIRRQMEAFRVGFNYVFPMAKLHSFSPMELGSILCGDQAPNWTQEDILNYTEPKLGYTRESYGHHVDGSDGSFPSVNTCVHYLKLPEYSSEEILRDRLLAATREKGFHLN
uniref:E3 ubiquitin-protein ligase n=1 Tax=Biomphalaria glabrata TaxID=6526 RepID=A0A2C9KAE0_BIOGL